MKIIRLVTAAMAALALTVSAASHAIVQSNSKQDPIGAIGNLFGTLAKAGAKSKAQKGWSQTSPEVKRCVNLMFSSKNVTVEQIAAEGIAPNDQRIAPIVNACNQFVTVQLRTNLPCTVTNSKGEQVNTTCMESYAKEENGSLVAISGEDFLRAAGNSEKVVSANFETADANAARLQAEQQQAAAELQKAQAERQRLLASAEGTRQAAAEQARSRARQAPAATQAPRLISYRLVCNGDTRAQLGGTKIYMNCADPSSILQGIQKGMDIFKKSGKMSGFYKCQESYKSTQQAVSYGIFGSQLSASQAIYECNTALLNFYSY